MSLPVSTTLVDLAVELSVRKKSNTTMIVCKATMMDHLSQTVKDVSDDFIVSFPESSPFSDACSDELSLSRSVSYVSREYLLALVAIAKPSSKNPCSVLETLESEVDPAYVKMKG